MGVGKDLTGQKFGELTVIRKSEIKKSNRTAWECQCLCGNKTIVITNHLTSGHTRSCGCLQKKVTAKMNPMIDLKGQHFGRLTVIERAPNRKKSVCWKCLCSCGNYCIVSSQNLRKGKTMSCGCLTSKGEEMISIWLNQHQIQYEKQKTFDTCRNPKTNYLLRFDFFINNQFLLEYDGITHFKATKGWNTEEAVSKMRYNDSIKNKWAKLNGIPLYRISYSDIYNKEKLNEILGKILKL